MNEIVCQVSNRENQVEFVWSAGGGFFRPYAVAGAQLVELRDAARMVRKALGEMVCALNLAGDGAAAWEPAYALAEAGFRLYNCLLPSEDETARKVRKWLEDLRKQTRLDALEIVVEEQSADPRCYLCMPWNLIYDERPAKHKAAFQSGNSVERWRPFWSIRYNLTSGRRVEPLKRLPVWREPRVIVVVDPEVYGHLEPDEKAALDDFLSETGLTMASSMEELEVALEEGYPRLLYWMGHANPEYLQLGAERIAPCDLRNLLRSFDDRERPEGMLAFLNACQTAEVGQGGSFLDVLHSFGFTGAIATEQQTIDTFANRLGLAFLRGFLQEGRLLGELLHDLRLKMAPLGLLYGAHCPPEIRVKVTDGNSGIFQPAIAEVGRVTGVALQAAGRRPLAGIAAPPPQLPDRPYPSLGFYDRADRALFTGRDVDIVRFAARLDRRDTRILILHGESGLGKSSFLRAGVIPYLEENCAGYRFLRKADGAVAIIQVTKDPIGQIAQSLLDVSERPLTYRTPDDETITIDLRPAIEEVLAGPADFEALRAALRADVGLFARLLVRMSGRLPHALVLIIDQAEELFTLARTPEEIETRDHTLAMIQRLIDIKADVKLIISLRTEYIGRLIDHLRAGRQDLNGVRDDLLRDFTKAALVTAIERPTSDVPIGEGLPSPRDKYGFRFAEGVAARIAKGGLDLRTEHQDSVLPLIQVICTQLYERKRSQPDSDGVISHEDLDEIRGVEGGLRAFVEGALERTLRLAPPDREAFKTLYTRLYSRQVDGTLTTWLAARDVLEASWGGSVPFAQVVEAAVSVRLLREDALRVEGTEPRPYIRLGHDALAKVAAAWQAERDEEERLRQERIQVEQERKRRQEQVRKLVIGAGVAACAAVLFGVMGVWALYLWQRAEDSAQAAKVSFLHAQGSERQARRSAREATSSLRVASTGVDEMMTEVGAIDLAEVPQMAPVRTQLLERARKILEKLRSENPDRHDPELFRVSARSRGRLGDVLAMLGQYRDAEDSYLHAVEWLDELARSYPAGAQSAGDEVREDLGWDILQDLVQARMGLAILLKNLYRLDDARVSLRQAVADAKKLEGSAQPADRELLTRLDYQWGVLLARDAELRGSPSRESPEVRESEEAYNKAIRGQEALVAGSSDGVTSKTATMRDLARQRTALGRYRNNLGKLLMATGRYPEAEKQFRGVLELIPKSEKNAGPRWQRARAAQNLGMLLVTHSDGATGKARDDRDAQGLGYVQIAKDLLEGLHQEFPEVPQYREELAKVHRNLGETGLKAVYKLMPSTRQGAKKQAEQAIEQLREKNALAMEDLRQAERLTDRLLEDFPNAPEHRVLSATVCRLLSMSLLAQGDRDQAEAYARKSIEHLGILVGLYAEMPNFLVASLGLSYQQLASVLAEKKDGDGSHAAAEKALSYHETAWKSHPASPYYARFLWDDHVKMAFIRLGRHDVKGLAEDAEALPRLRPDFASSYTQAAYFLIRCGIDCPDQKDRFFGRATELLREAINRNILDRGRLKDRAYDDLREREDFRRLQEPPKPPVAG